jgi:hypothetical protein
VSGLLHLAAAGTSTPRLGVVQAELKLGTSKVKSTQTSVELMNLSNGVAMLLGLTDMINLGLTVSNLPSGFPEPSSVRSVESKNRRDDLGEAPVVKNPADPLLHSTAPKAMEKLNKQNVNYYFILQQYQNHLVNLLKESLEINSKLVGFC